MMMHSLRKLCSTSIAAGALICVGGVVAPPSDLHHQAGELRFDDLLQHQLIRIEPVEAHLPPSMEIHLSYAGAELTLEIDRHSVRTSNWSLMEVVEGERRSIAAPPVRTYRGQVTGEPGSDVAATCHDGGGVSLFIVRPGNADLFVEPVSQRDPTADPALHLIYEASHVRPGDEHCGVDAAPGEDNAGAERGSNPPPPDYRGLISELAFDVDREYFVLNGSSMEQTVADVESIINAVNVVYNRDVRIHHLITAMIVRTAEPDPYTSSQSPVLLDQMQAEWTQNQADVPRDHAHLATGKNLEGSVIGRANVASVCNFENGYGLTQLRYTTNLSRRIALLAHELGHNWNAMHCNGSPQCQIMCGSIGGCSGVGSPSFGPTSINAIAAFAARSDCLDGGYCAIDITEFAKLGSSEGDAGDEFGVGVDIEGNLLALGGPGDDTAGSNAGAVQLLRHDGGGWIEEQLLVASDASAEAGFGTSVVNLGDTLIVGAPGTSDGGAVYVFEQSGGVWEEIQRIASPDPSGADAFGLAIDAQADRLIVGAPMFDAASGSGDDNGAVYLYRRIGSAWEPDGFVTTDDDLPGRRFGASVSISGGVGVVGAPHDNEQGTDAGAAYVIRRSGGTWVEDVKLVPESVAADDLFGSSVSTRLGTILAGAPGQSSNGVAHVFVDDGDEWSAADLITPPGPQGGGAFGSAVHFENGRAIVTDVRYDQTLGNDAGQAWVYEIEPDGDAHLITMIRAADPAFDDRFGSSVGMSDDGELIAVGVSNSDDAGVQSGNAYLYRIRLDDCNGNGLFDYCDAAVSSRRDRNEDGYLDECPVPTECPQDWNDDGAVDSDDFFDFIALFLIGQGDYNGDGDVDSDDFFEFIGAFLEGDCV